MIQQYTKPQLPVLRHNQKAGHRENSSQKIMSINSLQKILDHMLSAWLLQFQGHGHSKWSGWSGFGRTSFYSHFWNCTCADNRTEQELVPVLPLGYSNWTAQDDIPEKLHHPANYISFPSTLLGKRKRYVFHAFQSAWFSQWQ